jgi:hypothetical protein
VTLAQEDPLGPSLRFMQKAEDVLGGVGEGVPAAVHKIAHEIVALPADLEAGHRAPRLRCHRAGSRRVEFVDRTRMVDIASGPYLSGLLTPCYSCSHVS